MKRAQPAPKPIFLTPATASSADALSSFHEVNKFLPVLIVLNARCNQISAHFNRTEKKSQHRRICCGLVSAVTEQLKKLKNVSGDALPKSLVAVDIKPSRSNPAQSPAPGLLLHRPSDGVHRHFSLCLDVTQEAEFYTQLDERNAWCTKRSRLRRA